MAEGIAWKWSPMYANWYIQVWKDGEWKTTWKDLGPDYAVRDKAFYTPGTIFEYYGAGVPRQNLKISLVFAQSDSTVFIDEICSTNATSGGSSGTPSSQGLREVFASDSGQLWLLGYKNVSGNSPDDLGGPNLQVWVREGGPWPDISCRKMVRQVARLHKDDLEKLEDRNKDQILRWEKVSL
ncbi:hypothetical protein P154DRAFT_527399 [Amniculicola lignicola CBS 123094]|uniref:Uncharacterized protein n=1 Tax=Amniculicola lignicola CBS 123094 TaxID=1392246 RepID=A0A6A5VX51_9PLEO|nr:hypothetical protein P154DRAFT_527399 [Amniculicola lignicola CBS 123094]